MLYIYKFFFAYEDNDKQIYYSKNKTEANILWKKIRKYDKIKSISSYKNIIKNIEYYL